MIELLLSGLVIGLMGSGHCIAMCGGIISSLSASVSTNTKRTQTEIDITVISTQKPTVAKDRWTLITLYQMGRIFSYSVAGLIVGLIGSYFGTSVESLTSIPILKILSAVLLMLMGLNIARLPIEALNIEKLGQYLWKKVQPLSRNFLPANTPKKALMLGAVWGWLPCGLVYTSLSYAIATADPLSSAAFMLAFGLGTLPSSLLVSGMTIKIKAWLNNILVLRMTGLIFFGAGIFILISLMGGHSGHMHH